MSRAQQHGIEREFSLLAVAYAPRKARRRHYREGREILAWLHPRRHEVALDAACGPGTLARILCPRVSRVFGLDLCPQMIEKGRALGRDSVPAPIFTLGNAAQLPYRTHSFDLVTCAYAFANFRDPLGVLREFARVTRLRGRLAVMDLIAPEPRAQRAYLNHLETLRSHFYTRILSQDEFLNLFAQAGLRVTAVRLRRCRRSCQEWLRESPAAANPERARLLRKMMAEAMEGNKAGLRPRRAGRDLIFYHTTAWFLLRHA